MDMIKIHLKDFPFNIAIGLDNEFRFKLFKDLFKKYNKKELCNIFGVVYSTLNNWEDGKNLIPMGTINKIVHLKDFSYSWDLFEKNIVEYKTRHGEHNSIKNPILPITDSKELREIVLHLMADGCVEKYAAYYNYDIGAKKEFTEELRGSFGDAQYRIHKDHVQFSMAIPHILRHYFKVDFHGNRCRVPKHFFNGKREELTAILRAMIIDEGTIDCSNTRIDSNNKLFLEDIRNIASKAGYVCGKIWESEGPIFRFNILAESVEKLYEEIKPLPIKKKDDQLKLACDSRNRKWKYFIPGTTKIRMIGELLKNPRSSVELSWELKIHRGLLNKHIKWLKKKGLIEYSGKSVYSFIYSIKDRNKANEFIKNPENFIKDSKIKKWGVTQLKILKLLSRKKSRLKDIRVETGICKSAALKVLKSLIKKRFIYKKEKIYILSNKGKQLLNFDERRIKFVLYSNIIDMKDVRKTDLNQFVNA